MITALPELILEGAAGGEILNLKSKILNLEFLGSQFPHDSDSRTGAEPVGAGLDHGQSSGGAADAARSLDAGAIADYAAHQRDIVHGGAAEETGGGLHEVGFSGKAELAT